MQRTLLIFSIAALLCMIGLAAPAAAAGTVGGVQLVDLAVPFIENQGQLPDEVRYYANTFYGTAYVTDTDLTHAVTVGTEAGTPGVALKERFLNRAGSAISFTPSGEEPADTQASYFIGNDPAGWQTGLATYNLVSLGEIYPGITVKAKARSVNIDKLFYVAPGAAPDEIRIEILGAESLRLADDGSLVVVTGAGEVSLTAPDVPGRVWGRGRRSSVATIPAGLRSETRYTCPTIDPTLAPSHREVTDYGESIAVERQCPYRRLYQIIRLPVTAAAIRF